MFSGVPQKWPLPPTLSPPPSHWPQQKSFCWAIFVTHFFCHMFALLDEMPVDNDIHGIHVIQVIQLTYKNCVVPLVILISNHFSIHPFNLYYSFKNVSCLRVLNKIHTYIHTKCLILWQPLGLQIGVPFSRFLRFLVCSWHRPHLQVPWVTGGRGNVFVMVLPQVVLLNAREFREKAHGMEPNH